MVHKLKTRTLGILVAIVGLAMMAIAVYRAQTTPVALYDMNGDGKVDWHDVDVNNDGKVDVKDIVIVSKAYGSRIGEPNYNPRCDFNQDGVIDDTDLNLIRAFFGYPLSIFDIFNPVTPFGQLFIGGLITTILGVLVLVTSKS
jgi:hypothetical protein